MRREIGPVRAFGNALAALAVIGLGAVGALMVAGRNWQIQETFPVRAQFATVGGLATGAPVRVQGLAAGAVAAIEPPTVPGGQVTVVMRVDASLRSLIRADAVAAVATQGVVGSKVVEITPGAPDGPPLGPNGSIASEPPVELADLLRDARASLRRVDAVADAAERGLGEVNAIATTVREGRGSLGRLVQEDEAYDRLVGLTMRGERTLDDLDESLDAVKHTWPLSRYFDGRAYYDRDRLLFRPGAERASQDLTEAELFEPGRAVLTANGRRRLDELATWFTGVGTSRSEVVIAAFTDVDLADDLAEALTQDQADAVRRYLIEKHRIASTGWFSSRKVAAVGFGRQVPRAMAGVAAAGRPSRRVEFIVFTPAA